MSLLMRRMMMAGMEEEEMAKEWKLIGTAEALNDGDELKIESEYGLEEVVIKAKFATVNASKTLGVLINESVSLACANYTSNTLREEIIVLKKVGINNLQGILLKSGETMWGITTHVHFFQKFDEGVINSIGLSATNDTVKAGSIIEIYAR